MGIVRARSPTGLSSAEAMVRRWGSTALVTSLVVSLSLLATAGATASPSVRPMPPSSGLAPLTGTICNPPNPDPLLNRTPASLSIEGSTPGHGGLAGNEINVTVEFKVKNFVHADKKVELTIPSMKAVLPVLPPGAPVSLTFSPSTLSFAGPGWSAPSQLVESKKLTSQVNFSKSTPSYLTTSKLAVMATTGYGNLTIEFRWQWSIYNPSTHGLQTGLWTTPSSNVSAPYLPSIFFPAPFVGLVATGRQPANAGSNYTVELNGSVTNTSFRIVLEYPNNGTNIQSIWENTSVHARTFNATMPLSFPNGTGIPSGTYLIHVHDHCQAIVHLISVAVVASGGYGSTSQSPPLSGREPGDD